MFTMSLLKKGVLPGVPKCPNPPKTDRVSPWLFANLHKTASKQRQKMPKNTLEVSWTYVRKTQKFLSKNYEKVKKELRKAS
jgi:hypothetical protein